MTASHSKKKVCRKENSFYLSKKCVMAASFQYLPARTQKIVGIIKKNAKLTRKDIQHLCMINSLISSKKLKRVVRRRIMSRSTFTV